MHRWMVPVAAIICIGLLAVSDSIESAVVAGVYGVAGIGLYLVSATAHYKVWDSARLHFLFRLDQSMIMTFIAASTLPVAYLIGERSGVWLGAGMAVGALLGIVLIWAPFHPPRGFTNGLFLVVAWWPVLFIRSIADALGPTGLVLLLGGGAVYTLGSVVVGLQRPNPDPEVFGYHEIWHIFVIVAHAIHTVMVGLIVSGTL